MCEIWGVVMYHGVGEEMRRGGELFESRLLYGKALALVKGQIAGFSTM